MNTHPINSKPAPATTHPRIAVRSAGSVPASQPLTHPGRAADPWLDSCLTLRSDLRFDSRCEDLAPFVVIEDPVRSKFFQVGPREYRFIASIDGTKTPREITHALNEQLGHEEPAYDDPTATQICQWLVHSNLVFGEAIDNATRLNTQANALKRFQLMGFINPISCKFKLFNPNKILTWLQPYTQWLFSNWFFGVWCVVAIYFLTLCCTHWDKMGTASIGILSGYSWIWMLMVWIGLKLIHETAHGIACRRYGGEVPETGILLLLFTPIVYVNVTSMWRFPNRWHRMVVAGAGMYVELFISFLALILWTRTTGLVASLAFNVFVMSSVTTLLFNANPLMRFDGYFLLSDLLKIPNLYRKGTRWFGDQLKSLFFGVPPTPNLCVRSELRRVALYGCLAFLWKLSISVGLIIGASVLFNGLGILLAAAGVLFWFGLPLYRQFKQLFGNHASSPACPSRVALSLGVACAIGITFFWVLKAPATKSSPAIVQFEDSSIVRAQANGFIQELLVTDGERVALGQRLMVLNNPTLANEVVELKRLANESLIQYRIHKQQQELAMAMVELRNHEALNTQLAEKRAAADGLIVTSPRDGFLFQRNLSHRIGSFVKRGDPLLSIAQRQIKEVVVSIDQRDFESLKGNEGTKIRVAMPGTPVFESTLVRVNPRASEKPTHVALCANAGGPLDVRPISAENPSSNPSVELLSPRFDAYLELDTNSSRRLQSGQRGRAFFLSQDQSLGNYCFLAVQDWLENKIEIATQTAAF